MSSIPPWQSADADYAWEVATLFPEQGEWSEEAYLDLTDGANRRIEFTDGRLEFLLMPTEIHEAIVQFLLLALLPFVNQNKLGKVYSNGAYGFAFGRAKCACRTLSFCTRIIFTPVTIACGMAPTW